MMAQSKVVDVVGFWLNSEGIQHENKGEINPIKGAWTKLLNTTIILRVDIMNLHTSPSFMGVLRSTYDGNYITSYAW